MIILKTKQTQINWSIEKRKIQIPLVSIICQIVNRIMTLNKLGPMVIIILDLLLNNLLPLDEKVGIEAVYKIWLILKGLS